MTTIAERIVHSPLGALRLFASDEALVAVLFPDHVRPPALSGRLIPKHPVLDEAEAELGAYFAGGLSGFRTPLDPRGTEFQRQVWSALRDIPFGETRSYGQLANSLGRPGAARAVGAANGRNPLSIFVPCHRVVGEDGSLTGYAGGMNAKRWLLEHERRLRGGA